MAETRDGVIVRAATPDDQQAFLSLVVGLAAFEHLPPPDEAAQQRLLQGGFGLRRRFDLLLAEVSGQVVGYALFFETYSSFLARPTLFLEDIFVSSDCRSRGVGWALFQALVREAIARGCGRMEWAVLDWNENAIRFYERLGARRLNELYCYQLNEEELRRLSDGAP
jgi:GNAT superfamily N-acetyltransferase